LPITVFVEQGKGLLKLGDLLFSERIGLEKRYVISAFVSRRKSDTSVIRVLFGHPLAAS
jgi:hypothetical protein